MAKKEGLNPTAQEAIQRSQDRFRGQITEHGSELSRLKARMEDLRARDQGTAQVLDLKIQKIEGKLGEAKGMLENLNRGKAKKLESRLLEVQREIKNAIDTFEQAEAERANLENNAPENKISKAQAGESEVDLNPTTPSAETAPDADSQVDVDDDHSLHSRFYSSEDETEKSETDDSLSRVLKPIADAGGDAKDEKLIDPLLAGGSEEVKNSAETEEDETHDTPTPKTPGFFKKMKDKVAGIFSRKSKEQTPVAPAPEQQTGEKGKMKKELTKILYTTLYGGVGVKAVADLCLLVKKGEGGRESSDAHTWYKGEKEQKAVKAATKEYLSTLVQQADEEVIDYLARVEGNQTKLLEVIENSKYIDEPSRNKLLESIKKIGRLGEEESLDDYRARQSQINAAVDAYLVAKVSRISMARDAMVSVLALSGLSMVSVGVYGAGAAGERVRKESISKKQVAFEAGEAGKKEAFARVLKDALVNSTVDTFNGLTLHAFKKTEQPLTKTQKGLAFARSFGAVARGFGMLALGGQAIHDADGFINSLAQHGGLNVFANVHTRVDQMLTGYKRIFTGEMETELWGRAKAGVGDLYHWIAGDNYTPEQMGEVKDNLHTWIDERVQSAADAVAGKHVEIEPSSAHYMGTAVLAKYTMDHFDGKTLDQLSGSELKTLVTQINRGDFDVEKTLRQAVPGLASFESRTIPTPSTSGAVEPVLASTRGGGTPMISETRTSGSIGGDHKTEDVPVKTDSTVDTLEGGGIAKTTQVKEGESITKLFERLKGEIGFTGKALNSDVAKGKMYDLGYRFLDKHNNEVDLSTVSQAAVLRGDVNIYHPQALPANAEVQVMKDGSVKIAGWDTADTDQHGRSEHYSGVKLKADVHVPEKDQTQIHSVLETAQTNRDLASDLMSKAGGHNTDGDYNEWFKSNVKAPSAWGRFFGPNSPWKITEMQQVGEKLKITLTDDRGEVMNLQARVSSFIEANNKFELSAGRGALATLATETRMDMSQYFHPPQKPILEKLPGDSGFQLKGGKFGNSPAIVLFDANGNRTALLAQDQDSPGMPFRKVADNHIPVGTPDKLDNIVPAHRDLHWKDVTAPGTKGADVPVGSSGAAHGAEVGSGGARAGVDHVDAHRATADVAAFDQSPGGQLLSQLEHRLAGKSGSSAGAYADGWRVMESQDKSSVDIFIIESKSLGQVFKDLSSVSKTPDLPAIASQKLDGLYKEAFKNLAFLDSKVFGQNSDPELVADHYNQLGGNGEYFRTDLHDVYQLAAIKAQEMFGHYGDHGGVFWQIPNGNDARVLEYESTGVKIPVTQLEKFAHMKTAGFLTSVKYGEPGSTLTKEQDQLREALFKQIENRYDEDTRVEIVNKLVENGSYWANKPMNKFLFEFAHKYFS